MAAYNNKTTIRSIGARAVILNTFEPHRRYIHSWLQLFTGDNGKDFYAKFVSMIYSIIACKQTLR